MTDAHVQHPLFARLYTLMTRAEPAELQDRPHELVDGLSGRVVEVGSGTGLAFPFYRPPVDEVVAVEPEAYLRAQAVEAAARAPVPVTVVDGTAEQLPATDGSFDAVVVCLVLCSVRDQARALAEFRRVLRSGGELRYYEHILSRKPAIAATQRTVDRLGWPRILGGCHTARDTPAAIAAAGFAVEREKRMWVVATLRRARRHARPGPGTNGLSHHARRADGKRCAESALTPPGRAPR